MDIKIGEINERVKFIYDKMFPIYFIKGNKNLIVDCGITSKAVKIEQGIKEIFKNKLDLILLTHSHYDHTGSCSYIEYKFNPLTFASERAVEVLNKQKAIDFIKRINNDFKKILNDDSNIEFNGIKNLKSVKQDDIIDVDKDTYIKVIETPGHTKCSISYYLYPDKILFLGDAGGVLEKTGKIKPLFLSSYNNYINSLKSVSKLDIDVIALPHNNPIRGKENVKKFLSNSINESQKAKQEIIKALKTGNSSEEVANNILEREYPSPTVMGPRETFMINLVAMVNAIKKEFLS